MPGALDGISASIGGLQAQAAETIRQNEKIFERLDQISDCLSSLPGLYGRVEKIEPIVERLENAHQRGKGILIGVGLAAGSGGATIVEALRAMFRIKGGA